MNFLSFKDELTGLYNRRGFQIFGEKYFTMAKRKKTDLLILYCDLDKFKLINDLHGQKEGDFALKEAAGILKRAFRDYDIISRFGGDEFVNLLDNVSPQGFQPFQKRMNNLVMEYNQQSNKSYNILISYGCSFFSPSQNENVSFEDLIEEADKKLYLEKKRKSAQTVLTH